MSHLKEIVSNILEDILDKVSFLVNELAIGRLEDC